MECARVWEAALVDRGWAASGEYKPKMNQPKKRRESFNAYIYRGINGFHGRPQGPMH